MSYYKINSLIYTIKDFKYRTLNEIKDEYLKFYKNALINLQNTKNLKKKDKEIFNYVWNKEYDNIIECYNSYKNRYKYIRSNKKLKKYEYNLCLKCRKKYGYDNIKIFKNKNTKNNYCDVGLYYNSNSCEKLIKCYTCCYNYCYKHGDPNEQQDFINKYLLMNKYNKKENIDSSNNENNIMDIKKFNNSKYNKK